MSADTPLSAKQQIMEAPELQLRETANLLQRIASLGGPLSGTAMEEARRCLVTADLCRMRSQLRELNLPKPGEEWPLLKPDAKLYALPDDLIRLIQQTLEYYCSLDTWLGERTGGVLEGCPRGAPDIHRDQGTYAGQAYALLVKQYPLKEVK